MNQTDDDSTSIALYIERECAFDDCIVAGAETYLIRSFLCVLFF